MGHNRTLPFGTNYMANGLASVVFTLLLAICQCQLPSAKGYGPQGHALVGAIADQRIAASSTALKVRRLLDGLTLEEAALLPDQIKSWDRTPPSEADTFHLPDHPRIERQLRAFWEANPPTNKNPEGEAANHHWFHYTDVPVFSPVKYSDGQAGRSKWDVVHMMNFCVNVLDGSESPNNARKITKPIALILLAHYVGDIHQPLHVGAEYFNSQGKPADPEQGQAFGDQGGGYITLILGDPTDGRDDSDDVHTKLHSYWDGNAVTTAMSMIRKAIREEDTERTGRIRDAEIAHWLASTEPVNWQEGTDANTSTWAESWANGILPIARKAHERLRFHDVTISGNPKEAHGLAEETEASSGTYADGAVAL